MNERALVSGAEGEAVMKSLVSSVGLLVVLAWAFHELVHLHDVRQEQDEA